MRRATKVIISVGNLKSAGALGVSACAFHYALIAFGHAPSDVALGFVLLVVMPLVPAIVIGNFVRLRDLASGKDATGFLVVDMALAKPAAEGGVYLLLATLCFLYSVAVLTRGFNYWYGVGAIVFGVVPTVQALRVYRRLWRASAADSVPPSNTVGVRNRDILRVSAAISLLALVTAGSGVIGVYLAIRGGWSVVSVALAATSLLLLPLTLRYVQARVSDLGLPATVEQKWWLLYI